MKQDYAKRMRACQQVDLLEICGGRVSNCSPSAPSSANDRGVLAAVVSFLLLASCSFGDPIAVRNWRNETVYVQVGEVVFELSPGRVYGLGNMKDKEINAALAEGKGTQASPLSLPMIRVGVPLTDTRGLDYDVSIAEPGDVGGARNVVSIPDLTASLSSVDFTQSPDRLSGKTYEGSATFRFSNGQVIESPVWCSVVLIEENIRNVFCDATGLEYRGNQISLRANDGGAAEVSSDFANSVNLISQIEWK